LAPRDTTALAVAFVSSHERGLCIVVEPFDSSPPKRARCVRAFEGGALTAPERAAVGLIVTFNL